MSKFCGVISTQKTVTNLEYPLQFLFLEIIADWLIHETNQLHEDFETKSIAVLKQQERILTNERSAIGIHQQFESISTSLLALEEEIQQNDQNLFQLEKTIKALENQYPDTLRNTHQAKFTSDYEEFLELLEKTDHEIVLLKFIIGENAVFQKSTQIQINPYIMISSILDCQNNILMQTETNIDKLLDKIANIDIAFQNWDNGNLLTPQVSN